MTQLSELLRAKAEEIRLSSPTEVAVDHLKQAGYSEADARLTVAQHIMEKEACNVLVQAGVDVERAVAMVKAAGVNLKDLASYETEPSDVHPSVELLQKAAAYIDELQTELVELTKEASYAEVQLPDSINKVAKSGSFTNEDLAELQKLNPETMTKLASAMEEPWEMGRGTGMARPKTDPFLEFLVS